MGLCISSFSNNLCVPIGVVALYLIGHYERVFTGWKSYIHINLLLLNKIPQYLGLGSCGVTYMIFHFTDTKTGWDSE